MFHMMDMELARAQHLERTQLLTQEHSRRLSRSLDQSKRSSRRQLAGHGR